MFETAVAFPAASSIRGLCGTPDAALDLYPPQAHPVPTFCHPRYLLDCAPCPVVCPRVRLLLLGLAQGLSEGFIRLVGSPDGEEALVQALAFAEGEKSQITRKSVRKTS